MSAPNPTLAALGRVDLARIESAADAEMERILARVGVSAPVKLLEAGASSSSPSAPDASMPAKAEHEQGDEAGEHSASRHPRPVGVGLMPHRIDSRDHSIKRFASTKPEPERVVALDAAHPASMDGRTIFPASVVGAADSPRYLVSGHNNAKLGKVVTKGPWKDFPIYHVTLEERATCPRSCKLWLGCYGNALPFARRNDHRDPDFLALLDMEVRTVARQHPKGFVVRLHTLGDFYSLDYLELWASLIVDLPNLHIFGYTARREDADDEESREIAHYIRRMTDLHWSRFAIRFSNQAGPEGTIVVDEPLVKHPGVVMCPAQMGRTEACATCGLCWAEGARDKTIGFLLHGRKRKRTAAERRKMEREQAASGAGTAPAPGVSAGRPARAEPAAVLEKRLIDEAVDAGRITACPPAFAAPTPRAVRR